MNIRDVYIYIGHAHGPSHTIFPCFMLTSVVPNNI